MASVTGKEIVLEYLKAHDFDGLFYSDTECGCGIDDLMGPCEGMQATCKPAYKTIHPHYGDVWYMVFYHRPTKEEEAAYWGGGNGASG